MFFSVKWYQEHAASLLRPFAFHACQQIPPQIKGIRFVCTRLLGWSFPDNTAALAAPGGQQQPFCFINYEKRDLNLISGSHNGPWEPLGNLEGFFILHFKQLLKSLELAPKRNKILICWKSLWKLRFTACTTRSGFSPAGFVSSEGVGGGRQTCRTSYSLTHLIIQRMSLISGKHRRH